MSVRRTSKVTAQSTPGRDMMSILNRFSLVMLALLTATPMWPATAGPVASGFSQEIVFKAPRRPDIPRKCMPKKPCPRASGAAGKG